MEVRPVKFDVPTRRELEAVAEEVLLNRPDSVSLSARTVGATSLILGLTGMAVGALTGPDFALPCLLPGALAGTWAAHRHGAAGMQAEAMTTGFCAATCAGAAAMTAKHGWPVGLAVAAGGALITGLMFAVLADNNHGRVDRLLLDFEQRLDHNLEPLKLADAAANGAGGGVQERNGAVNVGGVLVRGKKR